MPGADSQARRIFDILAAAAGLTVLSPLLLALGTAVKAYDGGPVLYRARRVGRNGQVFHLFKFRTMVTDADRKGPGITASGDTRVTPVGRWLRRTKLDELPQLVNVLCGDMTLVGPRPEDPRYVALYTPAQRDILAFRPGITSAASLAYRNEEALLAGRDWEVVYCRDVLPKKLELDLEYLRHRTFWTDVQLICRTLRALFR